MNATHNVLTHADFHWEIERRLWEQLAQLARKRGEPVEMIITDALRQYVTIETSKPAEILSDPLIGLFEDESELATHSEELLAQAITPTSGWTWKK